MSLRGAQCVQWYEQQAGDEVDFEPWPMPVCHQGVLQASRGSCRPLLHAALWYFGLQQWWRSKF